MTYYYKCIVVQRASHVSAAAALVWSANPDLSNIELRRVLQDTAEDLGLLERYQGHGMVRADLAVKEVVDAEPTYTLTLNVDPEEGGTVEGAGNYLEGQVVSLTATANPGYEFVNWTDEDGNEISNLADYEYTMPADNVTLTANFREAPTVVYYALIVDSTDGGSVTNPGEETFNYSKGTEVTLKAEHEEGYRFVNWTGDTDEIADVNAATTTITMNGQYSITANFEELDSSAISVKSINYSTTGGRNNDRHLLVTITLIDEQGNGVSGVSISIDLLLDDDEYASASDTTGTDGKVTIRFNNAPSGTYHTVVTNVDADGWDGVTPENSFTK